MSNSVAHIELTTADPAKAKAFYAGVFDWTLSDVPMPEGGMYTMVRDAAGGAGVGGIMQSPPGVPTAWTAYITVDDASATTEKAKSLGATIMKDVTPVPGYGKFSVIADPTGAVFGIWENEPD